MTDDTLPWTNSHAAADTGASSTPPTAAEVAKAKAELTAVDAEQKRGVYSPGSNPYVALIDRHVAAHKVLERAGVARGSTPVSTVTVTPSSDVDALLAADERRGRINTAIGARNAELERLGGGGSPRSRALIDEIVLLTNATPQKPAPDVLNDPEALRRLTVTAGLDEAKHHTLTQMFDRLKLDPIARRQFTSGLSEAYPDQTEVTPEQEETRLRRLWGENYAVNKAAFARAWNRLTVAEQELLDDRLGNDDLLREVVQLGHRLKP